MLTPIGVMLVASLIGVTAGRALMQQRMQRIRGATTPWRREESIDAALLRPLDDRALALATMVAVLISMALAVIIGAADAIAPGLPLALTVPPLVMGLTIHWQNRRTVQAIDAALPGAVGRLLALMRTGVGFQTALEQVTASLAPTHPLHAEWRWWLEMLGAPLARGGRATSSALCAALRRQTPSLRHALFLMHIEMALDQPHALLVRTIEATWQAMHAALQRRSMIAAELAYVRNTGIALFLINIGIGIYLSVVQWERVVIAYSGPLGVIVGLLVGIGAMAPLIGAQALGSADTMGVVE